MQNKIEKGFYYHRKHDPQGAVTNFAYEILGTAFHSESTDFVKDEVFIYRPLYQSQLLIENGVGFWVRPVEMFDRFTKITDPAIIAELAKARDAMYK